MCGGKQAGPARADVRRLIACLIVGSCADNGDWKVPARPSRVVDHASLRACRASLKRVSHQRRRRAGRRTTVLSATLQHEEVARAMPNWMSAPGPEVNVPRCSGQAGNQGTQDVRHHPGQYRLLNGEELRGGRSVLSPSVSLPDPQHRSESRPPSCHASNTTRASIGRSAPSSRPVWPGLPPERPSV